MNRKVRYYLRGLGLGIFLTTLVLSLVGVRKKNMTDEEIIARARELGMVNAAELSLTEMGSSTVGIGTIVTPEESTIEESPAEEETVQETPAEETPVEETPVEETPVEETPVEETPVEETPVEETPVEETPVEETPVEETPAEETPAATGEIVTITVNRGSGSETVARSCEKAGLVESATAFDRYLIDNGYSTSIRVGSHQIPMGSDMKTIAKILTGKN